MVFLLHGNNLYMWIKDTHSHEQNPNKIEMLSEAHSSLKMIEENEFLFLRNKYNNEDNKLI